MSRAHREIIHLARLLRRLADGLSPADVDRYLIRDGQRIIEAIERSCAYTMRRKRTSTTTRPEPTATALQPMQAGTGGAEEPVYAGEHDVLRDRSSTAGTLQY